MFSKLWFRLFDDHEYDSYWFDIYGDEELEIVINVDHPGTLREGYVRREFFTAPDWGGGGLSPIRSCGNYAMREYGRHWWYFDQIEGYSWDTRFDICRENFEE